MRRFLTLAAVCALAPAAAAATTNSVSGKFKGTTSQGKPVTIKVVSDQLEHSLLKWSATCTTQGTTLSGTTVLKGLLQSKHYKAQEIYTIKVKTGLKAKHTETTKFTVTGHHLKGSFRLTAVVYSSPGHVTTTCRTPTITFNAQS